MNSSGNYLDPGVRNEAQIRLCAWMFLLLVLLAPAANAQFTFTTNNGTIRITSYGGDATDVAIPSIINGFPVTTVQANAFFGSPLTVTNINVPASITNIGSRALHCFGLVSIVVDPLNPNYSSQDGVLFNKDKTRLLHHPARKAGAYEVPSSVEFIESSAFAYCRNLIDLHITSGVRQIGASAFYYCSSLKSITIPAGVTNMAATPFDYCGSLTNVTIGSGLTAFDTTLFGCTNLQALTADALNPALSSADGVLFNRTQTVLIRYPPGKEGVYTIPNGVTTTESQAFRSCDRLTQLGIPSSLTNIAYGEFYSCGNLAMFNVDPINKVYSSVNGVVFNQRRTELVRYPPGKTESHYAVPDGITNIAAAAFNSCEKLVTVGLNTSVRNIGVGAFFSCSSLASITIPDSVQTIQQEAFGWCMGLTNVVIGTGVFSIANGAFQMAGNLKTVHFRGDAPTDFWYYLDPVANRYQGPFPVTVKVYYLPGTSGWGATPGMFAYLPSAVWHLSSPVILNSGQYFGSNTNGFGFRVSWATNSAVVVEASGDLGVPGGWLPVSTNTLSDGWFQFYDSQWASESNRVYRVRAL